MNIQLLTWQQVNDKNYPISEVHRAHQRKMLLQQFAKVSRRESHNQRRWTPIRKYSGQLY